MARSFRDLLRLLGHEVELISELRTFDREGDPENQHATGARSVLEADRLLDRWTASPGTRPDLLFTYHNYHKAPDTLSPRLKRELGVPYIIAEPSISSRQADGPWARGFAASIEAIEAADRLLTMTAKDRRGLKAFGIDEERIVHFPPFLDALAFQTGDRDALRQRIATQLALDPERLWLVTVAMMREDVKRQSYSALIEALAGLQADNWQWIAIGGGPSKMMLEHQAEERLGKTACFTGELSPAATRRILAASDIFVWPAFNEAYGMAILEAQAAGLPVVVCREGGVSDVVAEDRSGVVIADRDMTAFTRAVDKMLHHRTFRSRMAAHARSSMLSGHSMCVAIKRMRAVLDAVVDRETGR